MASQLRCTSKSVDLLQQDGVISWVGLEGEGGTTGGLLAGGLTMLEREGF